MAHTSPTALPFIDGLLLCPSVPMGISPHRHCFATLLQLLSLNRCQGTVPLFQTRLPRLMEGDTTTELLGQALQVIAFGHQA
jgi:hypothetical protein